MDQRVRRGYYADAAGYLRDLVRRDREAQGAQRPREPIREGLASGPAFESSDADWADLHARGLQLAR